VTTMNVPTVYRRKPWLCRVRHEPGGMITITQGQPTWTCPTCSRCWERSSLGVAPHYRSLDHVSPPDAHETLTR
jgi:heterodisulfide reductase subunit C